MAAGLKSRIGTAVFEHDGQSIKLQANFAALEQLAQATGDDALAYIADFSTARQLVEIFYHLQLDSEYTRDEIQGAFFYSLELMMNNEKYKTQLASTIATVLGADLTKLIAPAADDTQKKNDA